MSDTSNTDELRRKLAAPFAAHEIKCRPGVINGSRAIPLFYIDARMVMDRLDDACGIDNWQAHFKPLPDGNVMCRLAIRIGGEWIAKTDVGGPSAQPDDGDKMKAAFSEALKRAAVHWGIGRFLYRVAAQWCDYDPSKKHFVGTPRLPGAAKQQQAKPASAATPTQLASAPTPAAPPPVNGISEDEAIDLWKLMKASGIPRSYVLSHYGCATLRGVPRAQLEEARNNCVMHASPWRPGSVETFKTYAKTLGDDLVKKELAKPGELWDFVKKAAAGAGEKRPLEEWALDTMEAAIKSVNRFYEDALATAKAAN